MTKPENRRRAAVWKRLPSSYTVRGAWVGPHPNFSCSIAFLDTGASRASTDRRLRPRSLRSALA